MFILSENALLPRILRYKTTWKTWPLEHKKSDLVCLIVETIFHKGKSRLAKVVHHAHRIYSLLRRKDGDDRL